MKCCCHFHFVLRTARFEIFWKVKVQILYLLKIEPVLFTSSV